MDFWEAFMQNEYAVLVRSQTQHDVFMEELRANTGCDIDHTLSAAFPYLYWARDHVSGWTGTVGTYAKQKITFAQWCEMVTSPTEEVLQPDLSEVL